MEKMNSINVIHIVHDLSVGGVEEAIRSYFSEDAKSMSDPGCAEGEIDLQVATLSNAFNFDAINKNVRILERRFKFNGINNPLNFFHFLLFCISKKPDVFICSLWRSSLIGCFLKLFTKAQVVCFLHNESYKNIVDHFLHVLFMRFADSIFVDSERTMESLVKLRHRYKTHVISFVTQPPERISGCQFPICSKCFSPNFVFWGRLSKQKNIVRACKFFSFLKKNLYPNAKFWIIGPDGGQLQDINNAVSSLLIMDSIFITGYMDKQAIQKLVLEENLSFYLQLSNHEGMAMSVVESMSMGLIPIVTPVGQIQDYIKDGENGFFVDFDNVSQWHEMAGRLDAIQNGVGFDVIRRTALNHWNNVITYHDDLQCKILKLRSTR